MGQDEFLPHKTNNMQDDLNPAAVPAARLLQLIQTLVQLARRTGIQDIYLLLAALLATLLSISVLITLLVWLRIFVIAALVGVLIAAGIRWRSQTTNETHHYPDDSGSGDKAGSRGDRIDEHQGGMEE